MHTSPLRPRLLLAVGLLLLAVLPATASAEKRDAAFVYLAGDGVTMECSSTGGSCFPLRGDERTMSLAVVDDLDVDLTGARYEVRDAAGAVLAAADFCDATSAPVPPGAAELRVLVRALDPVSCLPAIGRGSTGKVRVHLDTREGARPVEIDNEPQQCLEATPTDVGVAGTTDDGRVVDVDVLVLLDGIDEPTARELFRLADQAYAPLSVRLVPHRFQQVDFDDVEPNGQRLVSEAINTVRGAVPPRYDIVHVLTDKTMNVLGIADCLGGVRYPDRAFSVSSVRPDRSIQIAGPVTTFPLADSSAKTLAHELGHLLGAHHHLGNHHEGGGGSPAFETATVMMSPAAMPRAFRFSTVNGAIIRGHAVAYAQD